MRFATEGTDHELDSIRGYIAATIVAAPWVCGRRMPSAHSTPGRYAGSGTDKPWRERPSRPRWDASARGRWGRSRHRLCGVPVTNADCGRHKAPPNTVPATVHHSLSEALIHSMDCLPVVRKCGPTDGGLWSRMRTTFEREVVRRSSSTMVRSGDANQGGEMAVLTSESHEFDAAVAAMERVPERDGLCGPKSGIPSLQPRAI